MSYILDALKKNKPESDNDQVPDLSSDHASEYDYSNFDEENSLKRWLWPSVVMVLLLIVAILSFMLLNPSADEAYQQLMQHQVVNSNDSVSSGVSDKGSSTAGSSLSEHNKVAVNSSSKSHASMPKDTVSNEPVVINKPLQVAEPVVKKVTRLSASASPKKTTQQKVHAAKVVTKSDLPTVIYTTHIYATQPSDRFVMLNGHAYAEGDKTKEGFLIKEILENDLLIVYKGQEFTLPSLEDINTNN